MVAAATSNDKRCKNDHYETPLWMPWCLELIVPVEGLTLEPCCGKSVSIANYFRPKHAVITNDIDQNIRANYHLDLSIKSNWNHLPDVHWVITNPPYKFNWEFLMGAYAKAKIGVAFLLRSTWLEDPKSQPERAEWFWEHPMAARITMPRYAFRRAVKKPDKWQTDACAHVWGVWRKNGWRAEVQSPVIPRSVIPGFYENPEKGYLVCRAQSRVL